jgi:hypothetical protein
MVYDFLRMADEIGALTPAVNRGCRARGRQPWSRSPCVEQDCVSSDAVGTVRWVRAQYPAMPPRPMRTFRR